MVAEIRLVKKNAHAVPRTPDEIRQALRSKHRLGGDAPVGVKAPMPSEQRYDQANREFVIVVNTADIDLEDEVVVPMGCLPENGGNRDYIEQNKKAPWGHDYFGPAVASIRNSQLKGGAWLQRFRVAPVGMGWDILALADDGILPAASIGFRALDFGSPSKDEVETYGKSRSIVRSWAWMETSLTHFPMNVMAQLADPNALPSEAEKAIHAATADALAKAVGSGRISQKSAEALGLPRRRMIAVAGGKTLVVGRSINVNPARCIKVQPAV